MGADADRNGRRTPDSGARCVSVLYPESRVKNKTPYVSPTYVRGPAVANSSELVAWLATQSRRVRLPVVIDPRSPTQGYVGPVAIELDDTALGIPLADRLRSSGGARCALWLEGRWTRSQGSYVLAIVNVGERIESVEAATHAEAEQG
jgi:hypothetical protein